MIACLSSLRSTLFFLIPLVYHTAKEDPFECLPDEQLEQELTVELLQRFEEEVK
eukprot:SAG22_NODE_22594_length_195_cov_2.739583_1_plen_53_part_10